MKEHDEVKQNRGDNIVDRHALNSSNLGNDEFKSLGQASSELIAKLSKKAKVGAERVRTQPPSKTTFRGGHNVVYLNSKSVSNLTKEHKTKKGENKKNKGAICQLFYIFQ